MGRVTKPSPAAERRAVEAWNGVHPVGTEVVYWPGVRAGCGIVGVTSTEAVLLGGHTAVVWLSGVSGCIALSHVEVSHG